MYKNKDSRTSHLSMKHERFWGHILVSSNLAKYLLYLGYEDLVGSLQNIYHIGSRVSRVFGQAVDHRPI